MLLPPQDAQAADQVYILWVYNHHEFLDVQPTSG